MVFAILRSTSAFEVGVEVDQHIAAIDDVELAEAAEIVDEIEVAEVDHGADLGRDLPLIADLA